MEALFFMSSLKQSTSSLHGFHINGYTRCSHGRCLLPEVNRVPDELLRRGLNALILLYGLLKLFEIGQLLTKLCGDDGIVGKLPEKGIPRKERQEQVAAAQQYASSH